jgi:hypothetical protein
MVNKENVAVFFNFTFVLCVMLLTAYFVYNETNRTTPREVSSAELDSKPEVILLTPDEVETERLKFVKQQAGQQINSDTVLQSNEITKEEVQAEIQLQQPRPVKEALALEDYGTGLVAVPVTVTDYTAPESKRTESTSIYIKPDSGFSVDSITVSNTTGEQAERVAMSVSGTIFSINNEEKSIIISESGTSPVTVRLKEGSRIIINNKDMSFSDLKLADIVRTEGYGYADSNELTASTIAVTGTYQIIPVD